MSGFLAHRQEMVRRQIEARGIRDERVLAAMREVPREEFVPEALRFRAFDDNALPIACDQTISQPYVVAWMVAALDLGQAARVLEVGTGSGYAAAVLSRLAERVVTIERHAALADEARERLRRLGYANVEVRCGDGSVGCPEEAPFGGILVSAGAPCPPPPLLAQLTEGGCLVIPIGESRYDQHLVRLRKEAGGAVREEPLGGVRFVPLVGREGWSEDDARGWID